MLFPVIISFIVEMRSKAVVEAVVT
jgi:hypothetical protein